MSVDDVSLAISALNVRGLPVFREDEAAAVLAD